MWQHRSGGSGPKKTERRTGVPLSVSFVRQSERRKNQPPKSSKKMLSRSTPTESSIFRAELIIIGGPHM